MKLQVQGQTGSLQSLVAGIWQVIPVWRSRARQRRHLANLSPEQLLDVGITSEAARTEIAKPFWRA